MLNISMDEGGKKRRLDIHDKMISRNVFTTGQKVLLYQFCFKLISSKFEVSLGGTFVTSLFDYDAIKIKSEQTEKILMVNGNWIKPFYEDF